MVKKVILIILLLIALEQITLQIIGSKLKGDINYTKQFIKDIEANSQQELTDTSCREYEIFHIYSYKMCIERASGQLDRTIHIQFPSGFLTLIPRNYPDRYLFDGKIVGILKPDGSIELMDQ